MTKRFGRAPTIARGAVVLLAVSGVGPVAAQDTGDGVLELDTIVVEGGKRDLPLSETGTSVAVATGEQLEDLGITDLRDAYDLTANVRNVDSSGGNAGFVIRGLSTEGVKEQPLNAAPLTAVIIDGTAQTIESQRRGARGLWDVEQVEIYRGPQSTLQGRGALAGAVVVKTKDPTFEPEGDLRLIYGTNNRREAAFAVSGPVVEDVLALRLSGESRFRERGIDYAFDEYEEMDEDEFRNLRGKALYVPAGLPQLSFLLTLSESFDKTGDTTVNREFFDREFTEDDSAALEFREARNFNASLETVYEFDNGMTLTGVTSWLDAQTHITAPEGYYYYRDEPRDETSFSQDIRLNFGDEVSEWAGVVGLYYGRFDAEFDSYMTFEPFAGFTYVYQDYIRESETEHVSAYADIDWRFADKWKLTFGGRLLHEEVFTSIDGEIQYTPVDFEGTNDDTVFLPKLGLSYEIDDRQTVALTVSRGYRSGFYSLLDAAGPTKVDPEYLATYDLGYRIEDPAGLWRVGANVFYSEYEDQQVFIPTDGNFGPGRTENGGRSEMYGVEVEGSYSFVSGLTLFGSLGLLETEFLDFETTEGDVSGNEFPSAPNVTAALGAIYRHQSGFFGSVSASHTGSYYSPGDIVNEEGLKVDAYTVVNAEIGYNVTENLSIAVYADNLLDEDYITSLSGGPPATLATVSEPRTVGVELRARF